MSGIQKVILIGFVSADPRVRNHSGFKTVEFQIPTTEKWRDRNTGALKSLTEVHTCVIRSPREVEFAEKYLTKKKYVMVVGRIETGRWKTTEGDERQRQVIVVGELRFMANPGEAPSAREEPAPGPTPQDQNPFE